MEHTIRDHDAAEIYAACAGPNHDDCPVSRAGVVPSAGPCDCTCHDARRAGPS
jgi:hypothetical protein